MTEERICEVCGISSSVIRVNNWSKVNKTLCQKHYMQLLKFGKILERTEKDLNEIIKYDNHAEVIVYSKVPEGEVPTEKARVLISIEDIDKVSKYKWKILPSGYPYNWKVGLLSRFILGLQKGDKIEADHIDLNPINNKRDNLRIATSTQQKQNRNKTTRKDRKSKYKGVTLTHSGKWLSSITINKKVIRLGLFDTEEEAKLMYDEKAKELFGEFSKTNEDLKIGVIIDEVVDSHN